METIKLSLDAILAIPDKQWLVSMYEDNGTDAYEDGRALAAWVNEWSGGQFLLIEQYGTVHAECESKPGHWDCWHYDPHYALYLVPLKVWQACYKDVLGVQSEYEHKHKQCKADPNFNLAEYEERQRRDAEIPF